MTKSTPMTHMGQSAGAYPGVRPSSSRTEQNATAAVPGRRIERIADVSEIERALELAAVTLKPDELSARQLINRLMPSLYTLRKKGFSFAQMTGVLNRAISSSAAQLQTATVKAYYNEFLVSRLDECDRNLKTALEVTAEVEKITKSAPKELIAEAVGLKNALGAKQSSAMGRLLNRQTAPSNEPPSSEPLASGMHSELAPPPAGTKPPSAAGLGSRIGKVPGAQAEAPPFTTPSVSLDEIPIASPISLTSDAGNGTRPSAVLVQDRGNQPAGEHMVCTTAPAKDNLHPADADMFDGIAREFFSTISLEHPSIPGLMLSKEQRMYKERLKYTADGTAKVESVQQMFNRLKWKKPERQTVSRTQKDFVSMDAGLFKKSE